MHFITASAASALILAGLATAQTSSFSVATPSSLQQCTPYAITWTGGVAPFIIQITAPGNTASILETLATGVTAQTYTWAVNEPVGQKVTINIVDSTGGNAPSGQSPAIAAGTTTCLSSVSSSASAASASTSASAASSSSSAAAATTAKTSTSSAAAGTTASSSSAAASTTTAASSSNDAPMVRGYAAVAAGIVGVAAAALF